MKKKFFLSKILQIGKFRFEIIVSLFIETDLFAYEHPCSHFVNL